MCFWAFVLEIKEFTYLLTYLLTYLILYLIFILVRIKISTKMTDMDERKAAVMYS